MPFLKSFSILKASFLNLLSLQLSSFISQMVLIQLVYGTADLIIYRWNDELGFPWVQKKKREKEMKTFNYVIILMLINQKDTDIISDKW